MPILVINIRLNWASLAVGWLWQPCDPETFYHVVKKCSLSCDQETLFIKLILHENNDEFLLVWLLCLLKTVNTLMLRQNGCHFAEDIFKFIFRCSTLQLDSYFIEVCCKGPIDNRAVLVQIMAWQQTDDKPDIHSSLGLCESKLIICRLIYLG